MSTLQHTPQQALRVRSQRLALAGLVMLVAAAAATVVLIVGGSSSHPGTGVMHGTPQQQLQAVSGPRYGVTRSDASTAAPGTGITALTRAHLNHELQAVAGARYKQPGRSGHGRTLRAGG
jgi:hypothetical protein